MMGSVSKLPRRLQLSRPHQMYGLLILFCVLTLTFYFVSDSQDDFQYLISSSYNFSEDKYLVWNSKCHKLSMDPYDPSMKPFVKKEKFEAYSTRPSLSNIARKPDGSVYLVINQDAAKNYENLICYWAVITRPKISNTIHFDFDSKIRVGPCEQVRNQVFLKKDVDVALVTAKPKRFTKMLTQCSILNAYVIEIITLSRSQKLQMTAHQKKRCQGTGGMLTWKF